MSCSPEERSYVSLQLQKKSMGNQIPSPDDSPEDTEIPQLRKKLEEQESQIHLMKERIKRRDTTIDQNLKRLAKKEEEIRQKDRKIHQLHQQLRVLEKSEQERRKRQRIEDDEEAECQQIIKRVRMVQEEKYKIKKELEENA